MLPIRSHEEALVRAVRANSCVVLLGETGSGKTTQLPQMLYRAGIHEDLGGKPIVVTQPRRVAAISVAQRVAEEMGCELGSLVGYQVRFEGHVSPTTAIKYVTDGTLLRECLEDPCLSAYSVVVLDEAHIRSLNTDILFGVIKKNLLSHAQQVGREGDPRVAGAADARKQHLPKIVIMSATLEVGKLAEFFGAVPFEIPGRTFPVAVHHLDLVKPKEAVNYAHQAVQAVMDIHLSRPQGDVLVFLTGRQEIEQACDELFRRSEQIDYRRDLHDRSVKGLMVLPIYGAMPTDMQRRIFAPAEHGIRKVVVATEIASTSLTVDGIVYVVDSGFVKQKMYHPESGLDSLQVVPISRSEAKQRAGRAGRTQPGECFRLFSKAFEEEEMDEFTRPEIQRTSLTSVVLTLKCLGIHDVLNFPYLDPPEEGQLVEALRQLFYFDAIDVEGSVTEIGRAMALFPVSPSLARIILGVAGSPELEDEVLAVVAMLSVEDIFIRPGNKNLLPVADEAKEALEKEGKDDFGTLLHIFNAAHGLRESDGSLRAWCKENFVHLRAVTMALRIRDQLRSIVRSSEFSWRPTAYPSCLHEALCLGLFNNTARRSDKSSSFTTMEGKASVVFLHPSSALFQSDEKLNWVIFHELLWTSRPYMRTVCPISYAFVQELLPKLHRVKVMFMATGSRSVIALSQMGASLPPSKLFKEEDVARRTTQAEIDDAKQRYLERKRKKAQKPM